PRGGSGAAARPSSSRRPPALSPAKSALALPSLAMRLRRAPAPSFVCGRPRARAPLDLTPRLHELRDRKTLRFVRPPVGVPAPPPPHGAGAPRGASNTRPNTHEYRGRSARLPEKDDVKLPEKCTAPSAAEAR